MNGCADPEYESLPACTECRANKVKCEKIFPCKRCVSLDLPCLPQIRKRGRPSDGDLPFMDCRKGLRAYGDHLQQTARDQIRNLIGMFYWKNEHWKAIFGTAIAATQVKPSLPKLKYPDIVARSWIELTKETRPSMEVIDQMLADHQSWLPPKLQELRDCNHRGATLWTYHAYGKHLWFPNQRFAELFETAEEILEGDRLAACNFSVENMVTGMKVEENRRKRPPEVLHRICANSDHGCYFEDVIRDYIGKPHSCFVSQGVYCMNTRDKPVMCYVTRMPFIDEQGMRGGMFLAIEPLPDSLYLREIPTQDVGHGSNRRIRKKPAPTWVNVLEDDEPEPKRQAAAATAAAAAEPKRMPTQNVADKILSDLLQDPETVLAMHSNPALKNAFRECLESPLKGLAYMNDPQMAPFAAKISAAASALPGGWMQFAAALVSANPKKVLEELGMEGPSESSEGMNSGASQEDERMDELMCDDEYLDDLVLDLRELVEWADL
eukprot:TRINITY_DN1380_c0_g1_i4.p1 TRINITY_DN1380_c0_g1~~TRINITY_DN1380_c0_g1_i4.p1  ORF type:complete len:494 (-),score=119.52 TRINITY_DN1380_c0_g1_i4:27-1508(-)